MWSDTVLHTPHGAVRQTGIEYNLSKAIKAFMLYRAYKTWEQFSCFTESLISCILNPWDWLHITHYNLEYKAQENYKETFKEQWDYTTYQSIQLWFSKNLCKKNPLVPLEQNKSLPLTSSHSRYPQILMPYACALLLLCNKTGLAVFPCMTPEVSPQTLEIENAPQEGESILQYTEFTPVPGIFSCISYLRKIV